MSTSQVHRDFVREPMRNKLVTALAGIGDVLGGRLIEAGFLYAYQILGQYLALNKDERHFKRWLDVTCSADTKQQQDCWMCLRDWCNNFLNTSTSRKHHKFVAEPIGNKPVTEIAGIGHDLGEKLEAAGFVYAYHVLGQFLKTKKDPTCFKGWLRDTFVASDQEQNECYSCLKDWCAAHLD